MDLPDAGQFHSANFEDPSASSQVLFAEFYAGRCVVGPSETLIIFDSVYVAYFSLLVPVFPLPASFLKLLTELFSSPATFLDEIIFIVTFIVVRAQSKLKEGLDKLKFEN